jgi:2-oxoglutarate/2-oxoacid ferredoxin oxidoreductase subunit alpha
MALGFMEGNEAVARGAIASGCRFFSGYPITPATSLLNYMLAALPPLKGICLQGEDEISSMGYCLGASMVGLKVMTATSGPGISLCSEQISFAIGSEIPIVIVNVQRLGPSTGSPTRGADGDIQFMRWGNSGGLPSIVLSPSDVIDCYLLTMHGFNLAEKFRCPVFIASNKEVALTRETIDFDNLRPPKIKNRLYANSNKPYFPFAAPKDKPPAFLPIGGKTIVRQTSSTHGPEGYITVDSDIIDKNNERLKNKLDGAIDTFSFHHLAHQPKADTLIVCYGVTARAAKVAANEVIKDGHPVSLLILKTLWPVPETLIQKTAQGIKRILVIEMNLGQYIHEIKRVLPNKQIEFLGKMDGRLITPFQIKNQLMKLLTP